MSTVEKWVRGVIAWVLSLRVVRAALLFSEQRGGLLAAAVTFRALFSVFAAVALGFSVAAIWLSSRDDLWQALIDAVGSAIPGLVADGDGGGIIDADSLGGSLGGSVWLSVISAAALGWAAIGAIGNLRTAIRAIAGTAHDDVLVVWLILRDLLFAVSVGVLFAAAAVLTFLGSAFLGTVLGWLGLADGGWAAAFTWAVAILTTFLLDAVIVALVFRLLSGVKAPPKALWTGALIGAVGLTVLQQLSGLFVGGADRNPLLASFGSLIALLLWFNLSAQVILIACTYIIVRVEERENRVGERYGAETFAQRKVRSAERDVRVALGALDTARAAEQTEREKLAARLS
ncbi:YihY/virulence factor BrkB family protein [Microbacterium betulae]|uniref:YihY/virulence factor BrkB family protein n=1 Tax=Microbacterium betulae TaxID=2981139 RepID=A0AA97I5A7_9MICO|nr:YihY/virulence factor BrkB family protein [Microbacterium sp. AB]WOF21867.1 YihY/virulence factor BrkB family protein [Microbacterium sp. AB]